MRMTDYLTDGALEIGKLESLEKLAFFIGLRQMLKVAYAELMGTDGELLMMIDSQEGTYIVAPMIDRIDMEDESVYVTVYTTDEQVKLDVGGIYGVTFGK